MIVLSAAEFDPQGVLILDPHRLGEGTEIESGGRRLSRTATLDGGVSVHDGGFSHGDRDLAIEIPLAAQAEIEAARRLGERYPRIHVSMRDGYYEGVLASWDYRAGTLTLTVRLIRRISE